MSPLNDPVVRNWQIRLIGNPVEHSLSPVMHNAAYRYMAKDNLRFERWHYEAILCEDDESAALEIKRVKTGEYRGMNVTMPYKKIAMAEAKYVDPAVQAARGANVLVRREWDLCAYNTDGFGAVAAIEREGGISLAGKNVVVCGTGPTSMAIAASAAAKHAHEVVVFSRSFSKADDAASHLKRCRPEGTGTWMRSASYDEAARHVPHAHVVVDATPCGMKPDDPPVIDPSLLREGQIVFDTVYAHGETPILAAARAVGAIAIDGMEMLVEQAALSVEIWADALGMRDVEVPRKVMREAALVELRARKGAQQSA